MFLHCSTRYIRCSTLRHPSFSFVSYEIFAKRKYYLLFLLKLLFLLLQESYCGSFWCCCTFLKRILLTCWQTPIFSLRMSSRRAKTMSSIKTILKCFKYMLFSVLRYNILKTEKMNSFNFLSLRTASNSWWSRLGSINCYSPSSDSGN